MKKLSKILLVFITIMFFDKVLAAPVNTAFADDAFYECIIVKLNTDGFNSLYDRNSETHNVTKEELETIRVLNCIESGIKDVKGLELLTNLEDLNLSNNEISTIDLSKNLKINHLLLSNNKLTAIDLTKNVMLENIYLDGNKINSLNLKNNSELLLLNINDNKLETLDLSNNKKLKDFKAINNAFNPVNEKMYKADTLTLKLPIIFPSESDFITKWQSASWKTKDANIATVNQKGTVTANKSGEVNIITSVENVYSVTYNIKVSEITSDVYNIDDVNETIALDTSNIETILENIKVVNGEAMIYNTKNKYVTSGNIANDYKLKVMSDAKVLKTYTLAIVEKVANNNLNSLTVKDYNIDFNQEKTNYTIIVENNVESVEVSAVAVSEDATVEIKGHDKLVVGGNTVTVTVTSKDKTTKTYTINVIRKASENDAHNSTADVYLETLEIKNYELNFDKKVKNYDLKINDEVKTLEINAISSDDQAAVEISGNENLKNGSKIEIKVTSPDGATAVYVINISKSNSNTWRIVTIALELLALLLLVILCIILINRHNKKRTSTNSKQKGKNLDINKTYEKEMIVREKENEIVPEQKITKEVTNITDGNKSIEIEKKQVDDYTKTETYLEKTIRFRRVCPHCGTVNVLTNEVCYLCGKEIDEK